VFDTLPGLFIGISVSLLLLIYPASRPYVATLGREPGPEGRYSDIDRHPRQRRPPHSDPAHRERPVVANADAVGAQITRAAGADAITAVVIGAETIPFIDVTAARMLAGLDQDLRRRGVRLLIARDIGQVRDVLRSVIDDAALTHGYPSVQTAVDAAGTGSVAATAPA
jgi:SulP family sulfate permease